MDESHRNVNSVKGQGSAAAPRTRRRRRRDFGGSKSCACVDVDIWGEEGGWRIVFFLVGKRTFRTTDLILQNGEIKRGAASNDAVNRFLMKGRVQVQSTYFFGNDRRITDGLSSRLYTVDCILYSLSAKVSARKLDGGELVLNYVLRYKNRWRFEVLLSHETRICVSPRGDDDATPTRVLGTCR